MNELEKEDELKTIQESKISIILDNYDGIFSDFDPRDYQQRALSDDFLIEARKAARDKEDKIELQLLIPQSLRNTQTELKIKKRLRDHFRKHQFLTLKEIKKIKHLGLTMMIIGAILGVAAVFIPFLFSSPTIQHLFLILLEPAAWFTMWEGANRYVFEHSEKDKELTFYEKMVQAEIDFKTY